MTYMSDTKAQKLSVWLEVIGDLATLEKAIVLLSLGAKLAPIRVRDVREVQRYRKL